jgi:alkylhydroperoxidase family enzyme
MTHDGDDIRARVPDSLQAHRLNVETVLEGGIVDRELKALVARSLAGEDVEPVDERERAALDWAEAIAFDGEAPWDRLHQHFTDPELVELGYATAYTLGQLHWLRTWKGAG